MPPTGHQGTPEVTAVPRAGKSHLGPWRFTPVASRVHRALLSPRGTGGSRRLAETRADLEGKERQPLQAEGWVLATGLLGLPVSPFLPHATLGPSSGAAFSEAGPPPLQLRLGFLLHSQLECQFLPEQGKASWLPRVPSVPPQRADP